MALTHFFVPCFDEFFKQFKRFCRLNINRKRILNFGLKRGKTFCAKFVIIWSGYTKIILVFVRFDLKISEFLKPFSI